MAIIPIAKRLEVLARIKDEDLTVELAADETGVSQASIRRFRAQMRTKGDVVPKPATGGPHQLIPDDKLHILRAIVDANNDQTLAFFVERWFDRTDQRVSVETMGRAVKRAGYTRKKRVFVPSADSSLTSQNGAPAFAKSSKSGSSKR
jgi:transposase